VGLSKSIAIVALALIAREDVDERVALTLAAAAAERWSARAPGVIKVRKSEAAAIVANATRRDWRPRTPELATAPLLLEHIMSVVLPIDLIQALRDRTRRLAAAPRCSEDPLQSELKRLIQAEGLGDARARLRLLMADALLRRWLECTARVTLPP
jgi:hypothetical protein